MYDNIKKLAEKIHKDQIKWRRYLHQYPELSFEEHNTTKYLRKEVSKIGLKIIPLKLKTGLLAEVHGKKPGKTVAIRTDIDALPVLEKTGLSYKSKNVGCMHACGHDVHMSTILGTAKLLQNLKNEFNGTVRFIFQHAEEKPPGGARPLIENGALKSVSMILGLHVDPHLATGKVSFRDGVTMASVYDFDLIIKGIGGHAARPHTAVDAIAASAEVIDSIQKIISREIDPIDPAVITFGKIEGGTARNVIADSVKLTGTARTLSSRSYKKVPSLIRKTVAGVCKARGCTYKIHPIASYPVLKNNPKVNKRLADTYTTLYGKKQIELTEPTLGGEDFACYLEKVPGAMFRLGVMNKKIKADKPWHSPEFIIDENAFPYATSLLAATTIDYLNGK